MNSIPIRILQCLLEMLFRGGERRPTLSGSLKTEGWSESCLLFVPPPPMEKGRVNLHVWPMVANFRKLSQSSSNDNKIYRVIALSPEEEGLQGWCNLVALASFPSNPLFSALPCISASSETLEMITKVWVPIPSVPKARERVDTSRSCTKDPVKLFIASHWPVLSWLPMYQAFSQVLSEEMADQLFLSPGASWDSRSEEGTDSM